MSKSIYEESFNHLDELVDVLANIEGSFLYRHYLDNIRLKLKKAQKQEKLLGLYKEYKDLCENGGRYIITVVNPYDEVVINSNIKSKIKEIK